jgi:hypothetical protein
MARKRTIKVAALNVSNSGEDAATYAQLFRAAFRLKRPIRVRGDQHLLLTSTTSTAETASALMGTFARFTELDPTLPWLDLTSLDAAAEEDLEQVQIPDFLKPNFSSFFYTFFPESHKFVFEIYSYSGVITPHLVEKFLDLLNIPSLVEKFGSTKVNLIADIASLDVLFAIPHKRRIAIVIDRPNPDDLGDLEKEIRDRLERQSARRLTETLDAEKGKDLKPDAKTRLLGEVATGNGEVVVSGKTEQGVSVTKSTKEFPAIEATKYDPDLTPERTAFDDSAARLATRRRRRSRKT